MTVHREKECDSILRYQGSLRSLHHLYRFFKSSHIPRDAFMSVSIIYNKLQKCKKIFRENSCVIYLNYFLFCIVPLTSENTKIKRCHSLKICVINSVDLQQGDAGVAGSAGTTADGDGQDGDAPDPLPPSPLPLRRPPQRRPRDGRLHVEQVQGKRLLQRGDTESSLLAASKGEGRRGRGWRRMAQRWVIYCGKTCRHFDFEQGEKFLQR